MINESCVIPVDEDAKRMAAMIIRDRMPLDFDMHPEMFIRIASYPLGFVPDWAQGLQLRVIHIFEVRPILEKEPLRLEDSRLWC